MQRITSPRNPLLKQIRLASQRGTLTDEGCVVAESFHLLEEAQRSKCEVLHVLVSEKARAGVERQLCNATTRFSVVDDLIFETIATTESSQGVIALVKPPMWSFEQLLDQNTLLVILDGVQDPGNAGTIMRTAEAFGASGVVFVKGTASPFNVKTIRASAGSIFRLPYVFGMDAVALCEALAGSELQILATVPGGVGTLEEVDLTQRSAIIVGSEAHGVSDKLKEVSSAVSIATNGVESLNAAVAAGVVLYEASRQRRRANVVS